MDKPILIYRKNVDKAVNKIIIPKTFVEEHGRSYYMEIYADKIVLKPVKKGE